MPPKYAIVKYNDGTLEKIPYEEYLRSQGEDFQQGEPLGNIQPQSSQQLSIGETLGMIPYSMAQGASLGWADEALGLVAPQTAENLRGKYKQFQQQTEIGKVPYLNMPIDASLVGELLGGGAISKGLGLASKAGAPIAGKLASIFKGEEVIPTIVGSGLYGAGTTEDARLAGGVIGGSLGAVGNVAGQALGYGLGAGKKAQIASKAGANLSEAEKSIANKILSDADISKYPEAVQNVIAGVNTPQTLAEGLGVPSMLTSEAQKAKLMSPTREFFEQRTKEAPQRIQSLISESLQTPEATSQELVLGARGKADEIVGEALKRQSIAGKELYSPLDWKEDLSLSSLIKEKRKVLDEANAGLGTPEELTKKLESLDSQSVLYRDLKSELKSPIGSRALKETFKSRKGGLPKINDLTLSDYKQIRSTLRQVKEDLTRGRELKGWGYNDLKALGEVEDRINNTLLNNIEGLAGADKKFANEIVQQSYGGMSETARKTVKQYTRVKPEDLNKIGKLIIDTPTNILSEILQGGENIGVSDIKGGLAQGLKAHFQDLASTEKGKRLISDLLAGGTQGRENLNLILGQDVTENLARGLERESKMLETGQRALYNSATASSLLGEAEAGKMSGADSIGFFNRLRRNPILTTAGLLESLVKDPEKAQELRNQIIETLSRTGEGAVGTAQKLSPYLDEMYGARRLPSQGRAIGGQIGTRAYLMTPRLLNSNRER